MQAGISWAGVSHIFGEPSAACFGRLRVMFLSSCILVREMQARTFCLLHTGASCAFCGLLVYVVHWCIVPFIPHTDKHVHVHPSYQHNVVSHWCFMYNCQRVPGSCQLPMLPIIYNQRWLILVADKLLRKKPNSDDEKVDEKQANFESFLCLNKRKLNKVTQGPSACCMKTVQTSERHTLYLHKE